MKKRYEEEVSEAFIKKNKVMFIISLVFKALFSILILILNFDLFSIVIWTIGVALASIFYVQIFSDEKYYSWSLIFLSQFVKISFFLYALSDDSFNFYPVDFLIIAVTIPSVSFLNPLFKWYLIRKSKRKLKRKQSKKIRLLEKTIGEPPIPKKETLNDSSYFDSYISYRGIYVSDLLCSKEMKEYIDSCFYLSEIEKRKITDIFKNNEEKELLLTNEQRYAYLSIVEKIIQRDFHETYKVDGPRDMTDLLITPDYFIDIKGLKEKQKVFAKIKSSKSERLTELIEKELVSPFTHFFHEYISERNSEWYSEFKKELGIIATGIEGEMKVKKELEQYSRQFEIISNAHLIINNSSIENDIIIVSQYGVYVLEVKNLGSSGKYSLQIDKDGRWMKIFSSKKEEMPSPVQQNERHAIFLEDFLNEKFKKKRGSSGYIQVKGMIVIANNEVDIINSSCNTVTRSTNITSIIRSNPIILSEDEIIGITEKIKESMQPPRVYKVNNFWRNYLWEVEKRYEYIALHEKVGELKDYLAEYDEKILCMRKESDFTKASRLASLNYSNGHSFWKLNDLMGE